MRYKKQSLLQFFIFIICLSSSSNSFSQDSKQDSICKSYFRLARKYFYQDIDSAEYYTELLKKRGEQIKDKKCLAIAFTSFGTIYRNKGEYEKALEAFETSLQLFEDILDSTGIARTTYMIGSVYSSKGDNSKNIDYMLQSLRKYEEIRSDMSLKSQARILNSIGIAYYDFNDFTSAIEYYKKAYQLSLKLKDSSSLSAPLSNIAIIYEELDSIDLGLKFYLKAKKFLPFAGNKLNEAQIESNIGILYLKRGDVDLAIESHLSALDLLKPLDEPEEKSSIYNALGKALFVKGDLLTAFRFSDSSYLTAKRIGAKARVAKAIQLKIEILDKQKQYKELIPLFKEKELYVDSLLDTEKIKQISNMKIAYETEKKELLIAQQEKELIIAEQDQKLERILSIFTGGILILFLILLYLLYNRQKLRAVNEVINKKLVQEKLRVSELQRVELTESIELHQQEIAAITLSMVRKNKQIEKFKIQIENLDQNDKKAIELKMKIKKNEVADKEWNKFNLHFSKVHPHFYDSLLENNSKCTPSELRLAALMKMNLNNREIAEISGVSTRSVDQNKYRLKKKLQLQEDTTLIDFVRAI